jgi:LysM repeat protein
MAPPPQLSVGLRPPSSQAEPEDVAAPGSAPSQHEPRYITIAEGQSLSRIARATHLPARTIAAVNHLEPPYRLKAGVQLLIPDPSPPADQDTQASSGAAPLVRSHAAPSIVP